MQQRRFRPGDVLDDYCPRERRITDHAIVAMIDEHIKQTRCCVCDSEHEYKDGKLPPQRRKKPQAALFTQVLEGLQGPHVTRSPQHEDGNVLDTAALHDFSQLPPPPMEAMDPHSGNGNGTEPAAEVIVDEPPPVAAITEAEARDEVPLEEDEARVRRSLIRATLPRPEGQATPTRIIPEFTVRQPNNRSRHGRRRGGQFRHGSQGPTRFGRANGGSGQGQGQGQRQHGGRSHGPSGRRRGGKKR